MAVSWTGASLVTELSTLLGDTSTAFQSKVLGWLNDVQKDIAARHDWDFLRVKGKKILTALEEEQTLIPSAPSPSLVDDPSEEFTEDFADDTGFVYDSDCAEFSGGQVQQKDRRNSGYQFYDGFDNATEINWGLGTKTRTLVGGATVSGGELDCTGGTVKYAEVPADNTASMGAEFVVDIGFKPDFTDTPGETTWLLDYTPGTPNKINIYMGSTGAITIRVYDNAGAFALNRTISKPAGGWVLDQEYRLILFAKSGDSRCYLDAVSKFTDATAFTRDVDTAITNIGSQGSSNSHFKFTHVYLGNTVGTYDTAATYSQYVYCTNVVELPQMAYSGDGNIQSWDDFTETETNTPRYVLNSQYWTGTAWAASDNSWAQASPASDVATNIANLSAADTMNVKVVFNDSQTTQQAVSNLVVEYTGQVNAAVHAELATGGSLTEGSTYKFKISFYEGTTYTETEVSPESGTVTTDASHLSITLTGIAVSSEPLTTARRIYVSKDSGTYYYHSTISDNTTTSTTITTDTTSTVEVQDTHNIRKLFGNPFFETTINRTLEFKDIDQMRLVFPGSFSSGSAQWWAPIREERVLLYPKPSEASTLSFYFYRRPRDLYNEIDSIPTLPEWLKPVLKAGVIALGFEYRDRDGQQQKLQNYEDLLAQYISRTSATAHLSYRVRDVEGDADGWEI